MLSGCTIRHCPSLFTCLVCLLGTPFLTAHAAGRPTIDGARPNHSEICIEALGRFTACLPSSFFTRNRKTPVSAADDSRHLFTFSRQGCESAASISNRERRRRIISSLVGTEIPDLSVSFDGLKLGLDIDTDLTGIQYNGVRLDYAYCW